jgi:hypothetical protein
MTVPPRTKAIRARRETNGCKHAPSTIGFRPLGKLRLLIDSTSPEDPDP